MDEPVSLIQAHRGSHTITGIHVTCVVSGCVHYMYLYSTPYYTICTSLPVTRLPHSAYTVSFYPDAIPASLTTSELPYYHYYRLSPWRTATAIPATTRRYTLGAADTADAAPLRRNVPGDHVEADATPLRRHAPIQRAAVAAAAVAPAPSSSSALGSCWYRLWRRALALGSKTSRKRPRKSIVTRSAAHLKRPKRSDAATKRSTKSAVREKRMTTPARATGTNGR